MYASGAVSSMFLPFIVLPTAFAVDLLAGLFFTLLTVANVLFTVYFSVRVGDLHRAWAVRDIYQYRFDARYRTSALFLLRTRPPLNNILY
jgi:hypothetical protein